MTELRSPGPDCERCSHYLKAMSAERGFHACASFPKIPPWYMDPADDRKCPVGPVVTGRTLATRDQARNAALAAQNSAQDTGAAGAGGSVSPSPTDSPSAKQGAQDNAGTAKGGRRKTA